MAKQNYGGVYANMDFGTYEFREYPKHIKTGKYGQFVEVHNKEEEIAILGDIEKKQAATQIPDASIDHEKEALISKARKMGIPINALWSKSKLEKTIQQAEEELDNLPAEGDEVETSKVLEISTPTLASASSSIPDGLTEEQYKDQLIATAKELGFKSASRLWGIARLKASIAEAEAHSKLEE